MLIDEQFEEGEDEEKTPPHRHPRQEMHNKRLEATFFRRSEKSRLSLNVGQEDMKTGTAILNVFLMWLFGFASAACQIKLRNALMYPDSYGNLCQCLPLVSGLAVRVFWLWWTVPLAWGAITVAVVLAGRRQPDGMADLIQFHTSATLLVGVFMLGFFAVAGTMPFVSIVAGLK